MVIVARAWPEATATAQSRKPARLLWIVHHWVGLKLSLLMSFVLLTGTLAVFAHEMDWLMRPALRVAPSSVDAEIAWGAIAANAARAAPDAEIAFVTAPIDRGFAAVVTVRAANGQSRFLYAHPSSGAIQGEGHWVGAQRVLRNMHRHLNLPTQIGVPVVSMLGVLLLISMVTSLYVYKKWWRGFFRPIRLETARLAWGDLHRLAGVWSMWFAALIAVTGVWYLAESAAARAAALPSASAPALVLPSAEIAARLPAALAAAHAAYPGLRVRQIVFPNARNGAFSIRGQDRAVLVRDRANAVWVSAADAQVLRVADGRDLDLHQRISEMADPLHFGTFGGLWTKVIWFIFGLMLTGLSVSGMAIYAARVAQGSPLAVLWSGMGYWRWLALAGVATAFVLLPSLFTMTGD